MEQPKRTIPLYDDTVAIACSLSSEDLTDRLSTIEGLRDRMSGVEPTEHGLLLRFANAAEIEADLRRFAKDEKACCSFWGFEVSTVERELLLRWDGPPDSRPIIDRVEAFLRSDQPASALDGTL